MGSRKRKATEPDRRTLERPLSTLQGGLEAMQGCIERGEGRCHNASSQKRALWKSGDVTGQVHSRTYRGGGIKKHAVRRGILFPLPGERVGERGSLSILVRERFQAALVVASDRLVWELGQTCEAAGNGGQK